MNTPALAGVFAAWTAVQLALGLFFVNAYGTRQRAQEYLLFGALCIALAITDFGITLSYAVRRVEDWPFAASIANAGAVTSAALNVHFVLTYVGLRPGPGSVLTLYGVAVVLALTIPFNGWSSYAPLRVEVTHPLGITVNQVFTPPTVIAGVAYALIAASSGALLVLLLRAYAAGKREALSLLVGYAVAVVFVVNDILVALALLPSIYLTPYGFLIYGFGFANTLLVRYRHAAEELAETTDELRRATEDLRSSYVELSDVQQELLRRRQLASVGELAASIAHEVRNPLAVIGNAAANLRRPNMTDADRHTLFDIVQEEIQRLNGLVTELLRFARPVSLQRSEVMLAELVQALGKDLPDSHPVAFERAPGSPDHVWADPSLLRIALDSLIENAQQAMPGGGRITLRANTEHRDGRTLVCIEVCDSGSGMHPQTLERALDPFFTTRSRGTGLGLPIVQRIVEAHDGELRIDSSLNSGTRVTLVIPPRTHESASLASIRDNPQLSRAGRDSR